jgi:hypothetical protein
MLMQSARCESGSKRLQWEPLSGKSEDNRKQTFKRIEHINSA